MKPHDVVDWAVSIVERGMAKSFEIKPDEACVWFDESICVSQTDLMVHKSQEALDAVFLFEKHLRK